MTLLRRLRGLVSTALLWALAWGIAGAAAYAVLGVRWTLQWDRPLTVAEVMPYVLTGAIFLAVYGFLSGAAFAGVLMWVERRRSIRDLTLPRIAAWGALGGVGVLLLNLVLVLLTEDGMVPDDTVRVMTIMGVLGAACAAGSLALARRAPERDGAGDASGPSLLNAPGPDRPERAERRSRPPLER